MSDWIEQLERLTRLYQDGALTDAEFAAQKARLLEAAEAAGEPPAVAELPGHGPRPAALIGFALAAVAVIGAAAWYGSQTVPETPPVVTTGAATIAAVAEPTAEATSEPVPVAVEEALAFATPAACTPGDTLERVYKKLEAGMNLGSGQGLTVTLDGFAEPLQIAAKSGKDRIGAETASAELRFPADTTWHGLRLSRVTTTRYYPPETDGSDSRTINFLEPPEKVRRTLARLGFAAPLAPAYTRIDEDKGCGGAMQIEPRPGGAALVCSWGC